MISEYPKVGQAIKQRVEEDEKYSSAAVFDQKYKQIR